MIEMLGVLAIIGVLSVGGIAGYSKAMHTYKNNKVIDQATMIINNTRILFASQTSYRGISKAEELELLPVDVRQVGSDYWDSLEFAYLDFTNLDIPDRYGDIYWAGSMLYRYDDLAPNAAILQIETNEDICVALASHDWKTAVGDGLLAISIAGEQGVSGHLSSESLPSREKSHRNYTEMYDGNSNASGVFATASALPLSMDAVARACTWQKNYDNNPRFGVIFK